MRSWACLGDLPEAYALVESAGHGGVLAVHGDYRDALTEAGFGPDGAEALEAADLSGRRPLARLRANGEELLVRRFHHGGLLRWATQDRFGDPERPFRELILSERLRGRGIATPLVVAARACPARPFGWRLDLVTRRIEGAQDGFTALETGSKAPAARWRLLAAIGRFVGELHSAGLLHADLTPANLLVRATWLDGSAEEPSVGPFWVVDLDGSALSDALGDEERCRNLARLWRFLRRRVGVSLEGVSRADARRFLGGYEEGLGAPAAAWRADWRLVQRIDRRSEPLHAAGWLLEGLFGAGPGPRPDAPLARR